jgi:hypothetical protein
LRKVRLAAVSSVSRENAAKFGRGESGLSLAVALKGRVSNEQSLNAEFESISTEINPMMTSFCLLALSVLPIHLEESSTLDPAGNQVLAEETLLEVLTRWGDVSDATISYDDSVQESLIQSRCGLLSDTILSDEEYGVVVESLLSMNGLGLAELESDSNRLLIVYESKGSVFEKPGLPNTEMGELRSHPALRFRTEPTFDGLDDRQLPATLRPMMLPHVTVGMDMEFMKKSREFLLRFEGAGVRILDLEQVLRAMSSEGEIEDFPVQLSSFFRAPERSLELAGLETLLDVVRAYDELIDMHVALGVPTRSRLEELPFNDSVQSVPGSEVHSFMSRLLFDADFITSLPSNQHSGVLAIHTTDFDPLADFLRRIPANYRSPEDFDRLPSLAVYLPVALLEKRTFMYGVTLRPLLPYEKHVTALGVCDYRLLLAGPGGTLKAAWEKVMSEQE